MKRIILSLFVAAMLALTAGALYAGDTLYGITGLIETPSATAASMGNIDLGIRYINDINDYDNSLMSFGGSFGLLPKLEVSGVIIDSDADEVDSEAVLNAKYEVLPETLVSPAVAVGVVDITNRAKKIGAADDEVSAFVVIGKNLTSAAETVAGSVVKPLHGTIGTGTGIYSGIFAGLDCALTSELNIKVEFLSNGLRDDSTINAGVRYAVGSGFSLEAGALDLKDFYVGANYNVIRL